jgi:hypothetical protein
VLGYDQGLNHLVLSNTQVYIIGNNNARLTIPTIPNFTFLGPPGDTIWIPPQLQDTSLPYIGVLAEDIGHGIFNNPIEMEVTSDETKRNCALVMVLTTCQVWKAAAGDWPEIQCGEHCGSS